MIIACFFFFVHTLSPKAAGSRHSVDDETETDSVVSHRRERDRPRRKHSHDHSGTSFPVFWIPPRCPANQSARSIFCIWVSHLPQCFHFYFSSVSWHFNFLYLNKNRLKRGKMQSCYKSNLKSRNDSNDVYIRSKPLCDVTVHLIFRLT